MQACVANALLFIVTSLLIKRKSSVNVHFNDLTHYKRIHPLSHACVLDVNA
jgi:hypothetical protein